MSRERRRTRWLLQSGVAIAAVLWLASTGGAQTTGAEIRGKVADESGGVLPGTTITVRNLETGTLSTAVTGDQGQYRIPALVPGSYDVKAEMSGFATVVRPKVELVIGQIADLNLVMKVGSLTETVVVTSEAPIVETSRSGMSNVVTKEQVASLPILGRSWQELALLTPGAAPPTGSRGAFAAGGTLGRDPNVQVDGTDSNDDGTGSAGIQYSQEAIREFNVLTNRFSAEYGRTQSAAVNVISKSGTNNLAGSAFWFYRNEKLQAVEPFSGTKQPFTYRQTGGSLGGPLRRDRTHFFFVYEDRLSSQFNASNTGYKDLDTQQQVRDVLHMASGRLDQVFGGSHRGFVRGAWSESSNNGVGSGRTSWEAAAGRNQTGYSVVVGENWVIGSNVVNEFRTQINKWFTGTVMNFNGPAYEFPSVLLGANYRNPQGRREKRFQIRDDLSIARGNHALKFGVDSFPRVSWGLYAYINAAGRWQFRTDPVSLTDKSTWPQPFLLTQSFGDFEAGAGDLWILGTYAQDDWRVTDKVTLNVGIRYDLAPGAASESYVIPGNQYYQAFPTDKNNWGPRFGMTYAAGGARSLVLRGGVGLYQDMFLFNKLYKKLYNDVVVYTVQVRNPSLSDPFGGRTLEQLRASKAPSELNIDDPEMDTPHTVQASVGLSMEVLPQTGLSVDFVNVQGRSQYQWKDINLFESCQNVAGGCARPDPRYSRILMYGTPAESQYRALLVSLTRRFHNNFSYQASYTLSKAMNEADDASSIPDEPSNMFIDRIDWGPTLNDQRHLLVSNATVGLPYSFQVAGIFTAGSGMPHKNLAGFDVNGDGSTAQDRPAGWTRNSLRSSAVAKLDLRASRSFKLAGTAKIDAIFEFYNLLNRRNNNPASYGTIIGSRTFDQPGPTTAAFYQQRQAQVALRFLF